MAVDAGEFRRALETVCDIFKIPSLYSEQEKCLEALFFVFFCFAQVQYICYVNILGGRMSSVSNL